MSSKNEEEKDMSVVLKNKYAHLKNKLDEISKDAPKLKGKRGMIELDPSNKHHVEWFEKDHYKGE
ncbi:hypothetical protein [Paenibacillus donghaensis]|uniref:Uncharacterized protein n=1 Tax=Paenibacillus donghaensis TaxID=414771 RepID=A0A2Z2KAU8_9BACL|nr:hypothetical protein [Paenibacillus donghaensis]ASA22774.1 hypothetical protein B9T62_19395 [Paenibacillus donghaensis]